MVQAWVLVSLSVLFCLCSLKRKQSHVGHGKFNMASRTELHRRGQNGKQICKDKVYIGL